MLWTSFYVVICHLKICSGVASIQILFVFLMNSKSTLYSLDINP